MRHYEGNININHMRKFWYNFLCFSGGKFFNHETYCGENMILVLWENFSIKLF